MDANKNIGLVKTGTFEVLRPKMLAAGLPPEQIQKEISFAVQHINANKYLQSCDAMSVMMAVVNSANMGLTLNPAAKEAYLIPRNGRAVLDPSYVGLIKLIVEAGLVRSLVANVVYEVDQFELNLADNVDPVTHRPSLKSGRTTAPKIGYYCLATLTNGTKQPEWMDMEQIHAVRNTSESYKAYAAKKLDAKFCPWVGHADEMGRKTVIKRLYKYLPRTGSSGDKIDKIDRLIELDNQDYGITLGQHQMIETLLMGTTLDFEVVQRIHRDMANFTHSQANKVIRELQESQDLNMSKQTGKNGVDDAISGAVDKDDFYEDRKAMKAT